jgi:RNA polymerase subunit RPABC4/transcription elongation factor Spt4
MKPCKNCKTDTPAEIPVCTVCNYPIIGTEKEQAYFIAMQVIQKSDVEESIERLKKSRMVLFAIGAFYIVVPFTPLMKTELSMATMFSIILGLVFVGFAFLTYKKPVMALGIPLGITVLYYLILLLVNPMYFWTGILWKLLVLMGLGYGFFSVKKSKKILRENTYLASVLGYAEIRN